MASLEIMIEREKVIVTPGTECFHTYTPFAALESAVSNGRDFHISIRFSIIVSFSILRFHQHKHRF